MLGGWAAKMGPEIALQITLGNNLTQITSFRPLANMKFINFILVYTNIYVGFFNSNRYEIFIFHILKCWRKNYFNGGYIITGVL